MFRKSYEPEFILFALGMFMLSLCMTCGCREEPAKPMVDYSTVTVEPANETNETPIEPVSTDEPPGANVAIGPETDTVSVSDDEGRLPADIGYKSDTPPPRYIYFVTTPVHCAPCRQIESDDAIAEIRKRWPDVTIKEVQPNEKEACPALKIYTADKNWRYVIGFYPMPDLLSGKFVNRSERVAAMWAAIDEQLAKE